MTEVKAQKQVDNIWSKVEPAYLKTKAKYDQEWQSRRRTLIILLIFGLIPGILYYFFSYGNRINKHARQLAAGKIIGEATKWLNRANGRIEDVQYTNYAARSFETIKLPIGVINSAFSFFDLSARFTGRLTTHVSKAFRDQKVVPVSDMLIASNLLPELTGRRRGFLGGVQKFGFTVGKLVHRQVIIQSTVNVSIKMKDGLILDVYNTSISTEEKYQNRNKKGHVFYRTNHMRLWSGLVVSTNADASYRWAFKVKHKKFSIKRDFYFPQDLRKIEYQMESIDFRENFDLKVAHEEGVDLRKQFSINTLGTFMDLTDKTVPFLFMSNGQGKGAAFAFDTLSGARFDLPLNIENTDKFFKDQEYAKNELSKEFSLILNIVSAVTELKRTKFIKVV